MTVYFLWDKGVGVEATKISTVWSCSSILMYVVTYHVKLPYKRMN